MSKRIVSLLVAVVFTAMFTVSAMAQAPGQGPGQGANPFKAMQEKYKYTFQLMGRAGHIAEIDKDPKYTLTPAQAKQVLAVLKPLRSKPKLTQDQAKQALKSLNKVFTTKQLNAMSRIKPRMRQGQRPGQGQGQGPQMRGPQGGGGPMGGRPPQGQQRRFDPNAMKDFNPFYVTKAPKDNERAQERAKMWNTFFSNLEAKAKKK